MTPSQKLRSIADSTGLDGIADAIREIANEIEHNNAPAVPQGEPVAWCLGNPMYADSSNVFLAHEFTPDEEHKDEWTALYSAAPSQPVTGAWADEACRLLADLVEGLQKTIWSSWQSTVHFDSRLQTAADFIAALREKEKP